MRATYARYRAANREKTIAATIAWNKANRERNAAAARERRASDPQRYRASAKAWKEANAVRIRAQAAAYRLAHREEMAARSAAWERAHPDIRQEYKDRRRAQRMAAPIVERIDRAAIIARDKSTCYLCGRVLVKGQITLDHVIPLIGGGPHTAANLRVACHPCNSRKREHPLEEFLAQRKGA
jgi:5-methylcytosine-specific restriction endonuclease McrA